MDNEWSDYKDELETLEEQEKRKFREIIEGARTVQERFRKDLERLSTITPEVWNRVLNLD